MISVVCGNAMNQLPAGIRYDEESESRAARRTWRRQRSRGNTRQSAVRPPSVTLLLRCKVRSDAQGGDVAHDERAGMSVSVDSGSHSKLKEILLWASVDRFVSIGSIVTGCP
jgi:hypothetical protein